MPSKTIARYGRVDLRLSMPARRRLTRQTLHMSDLIPQGAAGAFAAGTPASRQVPPLALALAPPALVTP